MAVVFLSSRRTIHHHFQFKRLGAPRFICALAGRPGRDIALRDCDSIDRAELGGWAFGCRHRGSSARSGGAA